MATTDDTLGTLPIYDPDVLWDSPDAGSVFQVTTDIVLSQAELTFNLDVTLVFLNGAKIVCADPSTGVTLVGDNTKVVAPAIQIFGDGVKVEGTWDVDRVYPQWFGCTTYNNCPRNVTAVQEDDGTISITANGDCDDAGVAINKAIIMKHIGEVFLPRGYYVVRTPIKLQVGIQLEGEVGMENIETEDLRLQATTLVPATFSQEDETEGKFLIDVDVHYHANPDKANSGFASGQITAIRKLSFYNPLLGVSELENDVSGYAVSLIDVMSKYTTADYGAIAARRSLSVENVRFGGFRRAVAFDHDRYIDNKKIVDCDYYGDADWDIAAYFDTASSDTATTVEDYYNNRTSERDADVYAFDLGGLGDALLFEHNGIHSKLYNKALRVGNCFGGLITANIINNDCVFLSSRNIVFSCNHLEGGAQIVIDNSELTISENHIEVGTSTAICINGSYYGDLSIVNLANNSFKFIEGPRETVTEEAGIAERTQNLSGYDIGVDRHSVLTINNCFRYWVREDLAGKSYPFGIKILRESDDKVKELSASVDIAEKVESVSNNSVDGTEDYGQNLSSDPDPFDDFNIFNYKLSAHCKIKQNFKIEKDFVVAEPNATMSFALMPIGMVNWLEEIDDTDNRVTKYRYSFLTIWGRSDGQEIAAAFAEGTRCDIGELEIPKDENGNRLGVLLTLYTQTDRYDVVIRLYRTKTETDAGADKTLPSVSVSYVDVPLCGSQYLFDNGISVCGYKWNTVLPDGGNLITRDDISALGFKDDVAYAVNPEGIEIIGTK